MTEPLYRSIKIKTSHGSIVTPALIPVVATSYGIWDHWIDRDFEAPWDIAQATILSLYHILPYRRKEDVFRKGIHKVLGSKRPIVLDSGGFQYMKKGIELDPADVLMYQKESGCDIAVTFDYPITPGLEKDERTNRLDRSISVANDMLSKREGMTLYGAIHGSNPDEVVNYINRLEDGFEGYGIGSLVPRRSHYLHLSQMIHAVRSNTSKPLHAFGITGFPAMFALAYLGVDTFDSWTYIVAAAFKEYVHPEKLNRLKGLKNLDGLPECDCPVCQDHGLEDFIGPDSRSEILLSLHNLHVFLREVRNVREAIGENELERYILSRAKGGNRNIERAFKAAKKVERENNQPLSYR
ncbi:MAG TPA: tRNA-guanine transglycosylase [Candidatus Methanofastidiosa archaeon]|nr:tRNA-guanine transglycosylase [Candidatus Methanofastidiosa archaeon]